MISIHLWDPVQATTPVFKEDLTRQLVEDSLILTTEDPGGYGKLEFTLRGDFPSNFVWLKDRYFFQLFVYDYMGQTIFEGRLINSRLDTLGMHVTAKGYWDATFDQYYTVEVEETFDSELLTSGDFETLQSPPSNILVNGGFESAGGGGADIWSNWTESAGDGSLANETGYTVSGSDACKMTSGASSNTHVYEDFGVTAGYQYRITFYIKGDGDYSARFKVRDNTGAADIIAVTSLDQPSSLYRKKYIYFTAPTGCANAGIYLYCANNDGSIVYFDDIAVVLFNDIWTGWTETIGTGEIHDEQDYVANDEHACRLVAGSSQDTYMTQNVTVTASTIYKVEFETRGDGTHDGRYRIRDNTAGVDIIGTSNTKKKGTSFSKFTRYIETPVGCILLKIYVYCPDTDGGWAVFDDVSVKKLLSGSRDDVDTLIGLALDECPAISSDRTNIDSNTLQIRKDINPERPGTLIGDWVARGDASGNRWKFGIWEDRIPYYSQVSFAEGEWKVHLEDLDQPSLEGSAKETFSHVRVEYLDKDAGESFTTDWATTDTEYDVDRRKTIDSGEAIESEAEGYRDTQAARLAVAKLTISLNVGPFIHDIRGNKWPSWNVKAGDVIDLDELIADSDLLSSTEEIGRCFVVKTQWNNGRLTITPEVSSDLVLAFG